MKRLLIALALASASVSAQAADLARKAPILKAPAAVVYDWTGFYLGVNAGVSVGRDRTRLDTISLAPQVNLSPFGAIGGGQIGYNWQLNRDWLIGVETDFQASGETDNTTCLLGCNPTTRFANLSQRIDWFGTARARVGLVDGPVLSYVTGGLAYGHFRTSVNELAPLGTAAFSADQTRAGFTFGSGVEASLGGNWTGKIEYLYIDLGKRTYLFPLGPTVQTLDTRVRDNVFRAGVNYRFGGNAAAMPMVYRWTGFYVGGNAGSVTGRNSSVLNGGAGGALTDIFHLVPDGYGGGLEAGYNWQTGAWVLGIETDLQGNWSRDKDACVFGCIPASTIAIKQTLPWLGTVRGRVGYALGSTLFFGTAGLAYGRTRTAFSEINGAGAAALTLSHDRAGYTVGGGIESPLKLFGLLGPNWTAKTEYLFVDLGRTTDVSTPFGVAQTFSTRTQEHVFRGGINYHFN